MICIIDYGMGNTGSIKNMLLRLGIDSVISSDVEIVSLADKLILPGVGAFDQAMKNLSRLKLIPVLNEKVTKQNIPVLGICLGMQLMSKSSEEGTLPGLGWVDSQTIKFRLNNEPLLKVPHMGWNSVDIIKESLIFKNLPLNPRFYFVHSYHVVCNDSSNILATTTHGLRVTAALSKENIMGTQFHPEKSHKFGMCLLRNFAGI